MNNPAWRRNGLISLAVVIALVSTSAALASPGGKLQTPFAPMEQPVEVEIETAPGSLKAAPTWPELVQLLEDPYDPVERRPSFTGEELPDLNVIALDYNFLTAEPLRLRPNDGEASLDQPGILVDPEEGVPFEGNVDAFNVPLSPRTPIGALVASEDVNLDANEIPPQIYSQLEQEPLEEYEYAECVTKQPELGVRWSGQTCGYLLVYNPTEHEAIPPNGTVVAVPAWVDNPDGFPAGRYLRELEQLPFNPQGGGYEVVTELEAPVNEENFLRDEEDLEGVPEELQEFVGRPAAEVLGKSLFWDMQVGSDGIQSCASCHFHAGADNRTRNQVNPDSLGGDTTFDVAGPNEELAPEDFPFRKLIDPEAVSTTFEEANCGLPSHSNSCSDPNLLSDNNDVVSSMGVSQFTNFVDIPPIGRFIDPDERDQDPDPDVLVLPPDVGEDEADPIPAMDGFRRVEPRNTPTFHGAAFNLDNFWDGRARFNYNGGSVFGPSDDQLHIWVNDGAEGLHGLPHPSEDSIEEPLPEWEPESGEEEVPVRIKFASLASQAMDPPLSDFEMSFVGRNWPKIGKKLLQEGVTPLANQLVATDDSLLGDFSNQNIEEKMAGLDIGYNELIELAFDPSLWNNEDTQHFEGASCVEDPFDGYCLTLADGPADPANTSQFRQREVNFSLFFGLSVQAYEEITIPDDTPFDQFMDANPYAAAGVGQAGEQAVLFPTLMPDLIADGKIDGNSSYLNLIDGDPSTSQCDGPGSFCEDEVLGMDIFMGATLTAALPPGGPNGGPGNRNPTHTITNENGDSVQIAVGSNPFSRTARCMLCHLGPEQTDHSINIAHGLLKGDAEFEYPDPPFVPDPFDPDQGGSPGVPGEPNADAASCVFTDCVVPAAEALDPIQTVGGLVLAEEVEENPQDAVEVEPRDFATFDDPATWWDDAVVGQQRRYSFGDQGIYNIGLRPSDGPDTSDIGRGGDDAFGHPLSTSTLALQNIGGEDFVPGTLMPNVDPENLEATFEESGEGTEFPLPDGTSSGYGLDSVNPGFERCPNEPQFEEYLSEWVNCLPAGELHPEIDEQSGMGINTVTEPTGGPLVEYAEALFGADTHCGVYNPVLSGVGSPNFGWGPLCPNNQSGVASNLEYPIHGTWPEPNQVLKDSAFKAPSLRNVELTGPYFHTGSYLTLRQVVDFYMRGGDFPNTNHAHRDPNILNVRKQAFGFGPSTGLDRVFDCSADAPNIDGVTPEDCGDFSWLVGSFADALPDGVYLYDAMPDTNHPLTPEYLTPNQAENAIVKFLIALTDQRVKFERAPFDHPELFVPLDGKATINRWGRRQLVNLTTQRCPGSQIPGLNCFKHVPAVGAAGIENGVGNFLNISSQPGSGPDHFDRFTDPALAGAPSGEPGANIVLPANQVFFRLDEGLAPETALGDRWVSPATYDIAVDPGYVVESRVERRQDTGRRVVAGSSWSSNNSNVIAVTPMGEGVFALEVRAIGTARLTVQSGGKTMTVDAVVKKFRKGLRAKFKKQ